MPGTDLLSIVNKLRPLIEAEADRVNQTLGMTSPIIDALVESGLFRLLVPKMLGGFEADPSTILDVCEAMAYADGSVGWAFAQNTTVMGYSAYLDPTLALKAARLLAHEAYGSTVAAIEGGVSKVEHMAHIRDTRAVGSYAVQVAKAAVTFAYEASGSRGLRNPSLLQRCFRDMYVGAAHLVFDERNYSEAVKTRLGLEPLPF